MIRNQIKGAIVAAFALCGVQGAAAKSPLQLDSDIFVERQNVKPDGSSSITLAAPTTVLPGDNLVFVVKYRNVGDRAASDFSVTNPMPRAVRFAGTSDGLELVSIDGGKNWGFLSSLKVKKADGTTRPANFGDVTHVKWNLKQTLAPGEGGKLVFRGVVK